MPSCQSRVSVGLVACWDVGAAWKALCLVGLYAVIPGAAASSWAQLGEAAPQGWGTQQTANSRRHAGQSTSGDDCQPSQSEPKIQDEIIRGVGSATFLLCGFQQTSVQSPYAGIGAAAWH